MNISSRLSRSLRHLPTGIARVRRVLPQTALTRIEQAIAQGEAQHSAELRFVVEGSLGWRRAWSRLSSRERALELFAQLHVWDTQHNNGVLLYVLLADQKIELIADRAVAALVPDANWQAVCAQLTTAYKAGQYLDGTLQAIASIHQQLRPHFPLQAGANPNELPDRPLAL